MWHKQGLVCRKAVALTSFGTSNAHSRVTFDFRPLNKRSCSIKSRVFWRINVTKVRCRYQKWQYFLICWSGRRPFAVRYDAGVTWGFPDLSAGLPRPSLLFDGRRKKRLRSWREGRKKRDDDGGKDKKGFLLRVGICADTDERSNGTPDTSVWVNSASSLRLCAGVSPPSAGRKLGSGSAAPR